MGQSHGASSARCPSACVCAGWLTLPSSVFSSMMATHTVSCFFLPLMSTVSPRKSESSSILASESMTTLLSPSPCDSSTIKRFGERFFSRGPAGAAAAAGGTLASASVIGTGSLDMAMRAEDGVGGKKREENEREEGVCSAKKATRKHATQPTHASRTVGSPPRSRPLANGRVVVGGRCHCPCEASARRGGLNLLSRSRESLPPRGSRLVCAPGARPTLVRTDRGEDEANEHRWMGDAGYATRPGSGTSDASESSSSHRRSRWSQKGKTLRRASQHQQTSTGQPHRQTDDDRNQPIGCARSDAPPNSNDMLAAARMPWKSA